MHSFSLSTEQDIANFLKNKKFKKIFVLCGKKSYVRSGAKRILNKYIKNKITQHYYKCSPYPEISELKKNNFFIKNIFTRPYYCSRRWISFRLCQNGKCYRNYRKFR